MPTHDRDAQIYETYLATRLKERKRQAQLEQEADGLELARQQADALWTEVNKRITGRIMVSQEWNKRGEPIYTATHEGGPTVGITVEFLERAGFDLPTLLAQGTVEIHGLSIRHLEYIETLGLVLGDVQ